MTTLAIEMSALAEQVRFTEDSMQVELVDGRTICVPLVWFPRLLEATPEQLSKFELIGDGEGIHWPELDEDISVAGLLRLSGNT